MSKKKKFRDVLENSVFADSFRNLSSLPYQLLYDSAFFIVALLSFLAFSLLMTKISLALMPLIPFAQVVKDAMVSGKAGLIPDAAPLYDLFMENRGLWYGFIFKAAVSFILWVIMILAAQSFFRLLVYNRIKGLRLSKSQFRRFFKLNLFWYWSGILVFFGSMLFPKWIPVILFFILVFAYMYFTPLIYLLFDKKRKILDLVFLAFELGLRKLHHFLLHLLIIFAFYYVVSLPFYFFPSNTMAGYVSVIVLLLLLGWTRVYYYLLVKKIGGKKYEV